MRLSPARRRMTTAAATFLAAAAAVLLAGCGDGSEPPSAPPGAGGPPDAGGSAGPESKAGGKGSGVRRMAERLDEITRGLDPKRNIFINSERAALIKTVIEQNPSQRIELLPGFADELLKAGRNDEAIAVTESLLHPSPAEAYLAPPLHVTHDFLGLCYMRLGEQENCIAHHGIDSCLLPIRGTGAPSSQSC